MANDTEWFLSHPQRFVDTPAARIAYRTIGQGPPLLLIHGWPFSSLSFRQLTRRLSTRFTCYLPDTPGLGETEWNERTSFTFSGHAQTFRCLADQLGLENFAVVGHDTGATVARYLALQEGRRISHLVLMNTEMPNHRPPWIPLYKRLAALPGTAITFRLLLSSAMFRRSAMGYGGAFYDSRLLDDEFFDCYVRPVLTSPKRFEGSLRYLCGIDWQMIDDLAHRHAEISAQVLLIWGAEDRIFPIDYARRIVSQFSNCAGLREIAQAKFLVHEERPDEVAAAAIPFLS